jgi:hypothetical protein
MRFIADMRPGQTAQISQLTMQTAELQQPGQSAHSINLASAPFRRLLSTAALALLLAVVWLIMHRYRGLDNDAQLYALQALMRDIRNPTDKKSSDYLPLTAQSLVSVCSDPQLGFVTAKENVGFDPIIHTHSGAWKDWNLYDCRHVRSLEPQA